MSAFINFLDRRVGRHRREAGGATAIMIALLFVGAAIGLRRSTTEWPTAVARAQPFTETIVESGTLVAQKMMLYSSTIPGSSAKIAEIAPEGQSVHRGDVIVRFDASPFERMLEAERATLRGAEAEATKAAEDVRLEGLRGEADLEAAHQEIANAERGLANEVQGKGQVAVAEAEAALADANRELARARSNVEDLKPLLTEQFITRAEFDRGEQALSRAEDQARLATAKRDSLIRYERPAATSRAEAQVNAAREALTREGEVSSSRTAQRRAALAAASSRVEELRARIAVLTEQIERATVRAQGPGLVVYRDLFFGSDRRKPQVGDEVFPNQPVIALPDSSQLVVETRIREIDLHKVSPGQRAQVRVDAYPDLHLASTVASIGALAQEDPGRAGAKFFPLTIQLTAVDPRLRTGMTATVEIEVSSQSSAIVVPMESVFDDHGARYVVVTAANRAERRAVMVTAENDSLAAIAAGIRAGDEVLLIDPTAKNGR